ncbi:HAD-like domain-containing protein [Mycena maculata]|uniref:HAD-like domain-containing protein n=1 Tax=Mycena maculata TaxID=230809 RepID=A0AAD7KBL5_9AGAR|nr:HAD-like domain-containing protein [Mycena maculata]
MSDHKITTLLFDCDNTLVLSEKLAFEACAKLANEILDQYHIPVHYTGHELFTKFVGQNFRGMMTALKTEHSLSELSDAELNACVAREQEAVIDKINEALEPCVGVMDVLKDLANSKRFELAVVSSSALKRVQASLEKVGMAGYFGDRVYSAATSLDKPTSKPDPAIYLHACRVMGKQPSECVAIEDSKSGTTSAVRANIRTVGYVGSYESTEQKEMTGILTEVAANVADQDKAAQDKHPNPDGLPIPIVIMEQWSTVEFESCLQALEEKPYVPFLPKTV